MRDDERDEALIASILKDAQTVAARIAYFDLDEVRFVGDDSFEGRFRCDAVMMPVYTLVESASRLSDGLMEHLESCPWRDIKAFRNHVAHGYQTLNRTFAWEVAAHDIPELVACLKDYADQKGWGL